MSSFGKHINSQPICKPALPLMHNTLLEWFDTLKSDGEVKPRYCAVFKKPLLYFFYGRPAYRSSKKGLVPSTEFEFMPVCFAFRHQAIWGKVHETFPFDSGGAHEGVFEPHVKRSTLQEFTMGRTLVKTKKCISMCYADNRNYYEGTPRSDLLVDVTQPSSIQNYINLITFKGDTSFDDRRSAIEVIAKEAISLKGNLLAVMAPRQFLGRPGVQNLIENEWQARALHYSTVCGTIPSEYIRVVTDRMNDFLETEGLI